MSIGVYIYDLLKGREEQKKLDAAGRIIPPKELRESAERERREEERRREEANQQESGGVERMGLKPARRNYAEGGKVEKVMGEFKRGTLHSGSPRGPKVTNRKQALAIALSEARKAGQYAEGGEIEGPGGPTDDAVPINASDGEYIIPADVVHYLGVGFFDRLVQHAKAKMKAGVGAPGPWDEMAQDDGGAMVPGGMSQRRYP